MIPWTALVRHAPMILAAADRLLARTAAPSKADDSVANETAQLLHELAEQVAALTAAQERTARQVRLALRLSVAAVVLGAGALLVAVLT